MVEVGKKTGVDFKAAFGKLITDITTALLPEKSLPCADRTDDSFFEKIKDRRKDVFKKLEALLNHPGTAESSIQKIKEIQSILKQDLISINGIEYRNPFKLLKTWSEDSTLRKSLAPLRVCFPAHGDLNLSNVMLDLPTSTI